MTVSLTPRRLSLLCPLLFLASSCVGTRNLQDPVVEIETRGGMEMGVSTNYGIVFLGATARSGPIEVTAWFGDGPSIESSVIEPVGGGIYTAETEIRIPSVPMSFREPAPGEQVLLLGRGPAGPWEAWVTVRSDPRAFGILLETTPALPDFQSATGTGVFYCPEDDRTQLQLVGLVSGRLRLYTESGESEYLTVVGPSGLWRLVATRRDHLERKKWVYREDIL
jgi:hypothetical protein